MKGIISLDALMAFLLVIFVVFWIQSLTSMNINSVNKFGRKVQARQEAIRTASIMNSFYATIPSTNDYVNTTQGQVVSFENASLQSLFSKEYGSNIVEATVVVNDNIYEKAYAVAVKEVYYSNGEARES